MNIHDSSLFLWNVVVVVDKEYVCIVDYDKKNEILLSSIDCSEWATFLRIQTSYTIVNGSICTCKWSSENIFDKTRR